jgi:glycosyltransferase involved in cell wall biosynthesis
MRIAHVAPLTESVPPQGYGGTERVVSYLTEALVALGHEVTLYASGDSQTSAMLRPCCQRALRHDAECGDPDMIHQRMMRRVLREADEYDIIHFHSGWFELPLFERLSHKCLTTLHGRLNIPEVQARLRKHARFPLVSISDSQRQPVPDGNWLGTIYHGLPPELVPAPAAERPYLAFLGRISPEKRPDLAIEIAHRAGMPLKIAAKVDPVDRAYFESVVRPLLALPGMEYVGELGEHEKMDFLARARALLFPIDWPEPFGLVMIEAMAAGTPVIAFERGSVPEVIDDGVTGRIVHTTDEAVAALARLEEFDSRRIFEVFDRRFSALRMASDYVALYRRFLEQELPEEPEEDVEAMAARTGS